jgi:(R,R)-butanediol dehydrogenase / meso-butanediol dehydrogenase / diacetyl reductase
VLLEVHAAGICGTDAQEFQTGPHLHPLLQPHPVTGHLGPIIPGHEFTGRVVEIGAGVRELRPGDVVASGAGVSCGTCWQCARGRTNLCQRYATVGLQSDGALAQFCRVPADICLPIGPYRLTEDAAALAQPMAIAVHALRRSRLVAGEEAVVIGAGGVGAFLTFAGVEYGAHVTVADLDPERLRIAAALGAARTLLVDPGGHGLAEQIEEARLKPSVVYEVSGTGSGFQAAVAMLPPGGRLVAVGLHHAPQEVDLRSLTLAEQEVIGTNALVLRDDLPEALRLLAARRGSWGDIAPVALPLDELVRAGIVPLAEGRSEQIKTLVDPWTATRRGTVMSQPAPAAG